jgi:hypothetical protein
MERRFTMAAVVTSIPATGNSVKLAELSKQLSAEGELATHCDFCSCPYVCSSGGLPVICM